MPSLLALAEAVGGRIQGDPSLELSAIMPLEWAAPGQLSFLANPKYLEAARQSRASALIVAAPFEGAPAHLILHDNPYLAAAKVAAVLNPPPRKAPGVHPSAVIGEPGAPAVKLGRDVYIGPCAVIEPGAEIGDGCQIHAQSFVGENAQIGAETVLHPGVKVLAGCQVGARCVLHAGAVIGADGFGFAEDSAAGDGHKRLKVPQAGIVVVGDGVEIGANSTIDRATFGATLIGDGTKIDNLVMLAHNVRTGPDCVIVAQAGVSGSTVLGSRVIVGGQAGLVGHLKIGDDVKINAQTGVTKSLPDGAAVSGSPMLPFREWQRQSAALRHLDEMRRRVFGLKAARKESEKA